MKKIKISLICLVSLIPFSCSSGGQNYEYTENISAQAQAAGHAQKDFAHIHSAMKNLSWKKPSSWIEGQGDAMRMATYKSGNVEISLSAFPGDTGGLEPNLKRWAGQISLDLSGENLNKLTDALEEKQTLLPHVIADFVPISGGSESIIAAIFNFEDQTLFIKAKGPSKELTSIKKTFADFCASVELKDK